MTPDALAAVREGMAKVTDPGGTAYGLAIAGLPYSGKTGTAETAGGNGAEHDVVRRLGAERSSEDRDGGLRRPQRRLRRAVAAPIARQILVKYFHKKP